MTEHADMPHINILYEDNHLLAVEKPVNIPSQGDSSEDLDMLAILKQDLKERYNKPGDAFLGLVHRLDRPVGGAMIFAKTSKAASRLSEQIRQRTFKKTYLAVLHGTPENKTATLEHYLLKDSKTNTVRAVQPSFKDAKEAVLDYEILETANGFSLARVNLHTGRPHQIRVQFSTIGHPLLGDQKYGARLNRAGQQIALWSYEICCKHPTRDEQMRFTCRPPEIYPWNLFNVDFH